MTARAMTAHEVDISLVRRLVEADLTAFLGLKAGATAESRPLRELSEILRDFLFTGGKRIRPTLCVLGWYAAGGRGEPGPLLRTAASLEVFHMSALIHDDIMDRSATRRGRPTVHRVLADRHEGPDAERFGVHTATLAGYLAFSWSLEMVHTAGLSGDQLAAALSIMDRMRHETVCGQYLDLRSTGTPGPDLEHALAIGHYKSAKYTFERPLHLGAALAGASPELMADLTGYALPLGEAFQLRDDLQGVYGAPAATGKAPSEDLRQGKHTALLATALARADAGQEAVLRALVGRPDLDEEGADRVRAVLEATGARARVEDMITARYERAMRALERSGISPSVATALRDLAGLATGRPG